MFSGLVEPYLPLLLLVGPCCPSSRRRAKGALFQPVGSRFPVPGTVPPTGDPCLQARQAVVRVDLDVAHFFDDILIYLNSWLSAFAAFSWPWRLCNCLRLRVAFLGQIVAEQAYNRRRRLVLVCIWVWSSPRSLRCCGRPRSRARRNSLGDCAARGRGWCCWRRSRFSATRSWRGTGSPSWCAGRRGGLAIDLGLLAPRLQARRGLLESAAAVSQKLYEKVQQ